MSSPRHLSIESAGAALCHHAKVFYGFGWMLGTGGNLSVRTGQNTFLVTASGRHKGELRFPEDFVHIVFESDGTWRSEPFAAGRPAEKPSDETSIHSLIYATTQAGAVYHVHQPEAAVASLHANQRGVVALPPLEMLKGIGCSAQIGAELPIVANDPNIEALARDVIEKSTNGPGSMPAVLVDRHGIYTWARDSDSARRHVEILGYLLRVATSLESW